jgi:hypothetical protein
MTLVARQSFGLKFQERRHHERLKLALPGRYMLGDHQEHPCWTINVSPVGIAAQGEKRGLIGERVVFYIDQIGRLEGIIARSFDTWFAAKLQLAPSKREQLKETLAWLIARHPQGVPDKRLRHRIKPFRRRATLTMPDGRQYPAALVDLSVQGAALNVGVSPPIGSSVTIGQIAIEFDDELPANTFDVDTSRSL